MTREVIFEAYYGGKFWKKIICRIFMHTWTNIIDVEIGRDDYYVVSMKIMRCVDCGVYELWILKEIIVKSSARN